jgi:hypothetical protein
VKWANGNYGVSVKANKHNPQIDEIQEGENAPEVVE